MTEPADGEATRALREAAAQRQLAEARRADAEARKADAEAERFSQEARRFAADADMRELDRAKAQRTEQDELAGNRFHHVYAFTEQVSKNTAEACIKQLTTWMRQDTGCPIEIIFNSPGGSVVDGLALYDFIGQVRAAGHVVTTTSIGMAASMAGILLQAGDRRIMGREAWLLIHEASFGAGGKMGDVEDTVEWVKKIQKRIVAIFAARSHMTAAQIERRWKRKDWWLSSDDAFKAGFVDEIR